MGALTDPHPHDFKMRSDLSFRKQRSLNGSVSPLFFTERRAISFEELKKMEASSLKVEDATMNFNCRSEEIFLVDKELNKKHEKYDKIVESYNNNNNNINRRSKDTSDIKEITYKIPVAVPFKNNLLRTLSLCDFDKGSNTFLQLADDKSL
jgi:hypothetical protein